MNLPNENKIENYAGVKILVETALLGHGLPSIKNEQIAAQWPEATSVKLVWLQAGQIKTGGIAEFLSIRLTGQDWRRANSDNLAAMINARQNAFLTVSALIALFDNEDNKSIIVTAGLGGIRDNTISADLQVIQKSHAIVFATAFKDVLDYEQTFNYINANKINIGGWKNSVFDGFIFRHPLAYKLKSIDEESLYWQMQKNNHVIILNGIPLHKRIDDSGILQQARQAGEEGGKQGEQFHPAVNKALDQLTAGKSSELQLQALVDNLSAAGELLDMMQTK